MLGGDWGGPTEMLGEAGEQAGDTRGDFLSGLMVLQGNNTVNSLTWLEQFYDDNSPILIVILPDQRGDVEAPERFLVWEFSGRG